MIFKALKFFLLFSLLIGATYLIQVYGIQSPLKDNETTLVNFSYLFNYAFTYFLILNIILFYDILKDKLGFVYLGVSMLKFMLFYFLINSKNIEINKSDFLLFFIPFVLCLGIELFYVSKILNNLNTNKTK